jgi:pyruvate kinase
MAAKPADQGVPRLFALAQDLDALQAAMVEFESQHAQVLGTVAPVHAASARNLLHYLAMRKRDLRSLQTQLATLGLSSIGRAEAHALSAVNTVLEVVRRITKEPMHVLHEEPPCNLASGASLLEAHTAALLGAEPADRSVHIMVTVPSEAAHDYTVVERVLTNGMSCMRINCAHDGPPQWQKMIEHLRHACTVLNRQCIVLMDLGGPKLRTGEVEPGAAVQKLRPSRDAYGQVSAPARVWLTSREAPASPPSSADGVLHVDQDWLSVIGHGDQVTFEDTRGRHRKLTIVDRDRGGLWGELTRTAYLTNGTKLACRAAENREPRLTEVSGIATAEGVIPLSTDDLLVLTKDPLPGRKASFDSVGRLLSPARVSCTLPEVFADVRAGERVCLDDGRITGVAEAVSKTEIRVRVQHTPPRGARLKGDKGINLPDSRLRLPALTAKDKADLEFVARHADLVGLSFANQESDVLELIDALHAHGGQRLGIVLKIETRRGFQRLPAMLLTAMRHDRVGVMIARGDLAVECGYERLAEAQEEILWICEAAHCPAIWATQVLETLAKEGTPSRAEITDAAMGHRAECVMLNKGPHIDEALRVLDDILKRMDAHQSKKRAMLRALRLATEFEIASPQ